MMETRRASRLDSGSPNRKVFGLRTIAAHGHALALATRQRSELAPQQRRAQVSPPRPIDAFWAERARLEGFDAVLGHPPPMFASLTFRMEPLPWPRCSARRSRRS